MRKATWVGAVFILLGTLSPARGQLVERFDYPGGDLTAVSGGLWERWSPASEGGTVTADGLRIDDATDVIRFFPDPFALGNSAVISFDVSVNQGNTSENYSIFFGPASSPGESGTNYANSLSVRFDPMALAQPGLTDVSVRNDGLGSHPRFTSISTGQTHHFHFELQRAEPLVNYALFIDGALALESSFTLTDPRGLNSVELWCYTDSTASPGQVPAAFATIDNIQVLPEPAALAAPLAAVLLLHRRRGRAACEEGGLT